MYHHVASSDSVSANPWEETNHAVVVVGWGVDDATQENYWIVKNSWGRHFGLTGYFYVRRSTDEIAIESMALSAGVWRGARHRCRVMRCVTCFCRTCHPAHGRCWTRSRARVKLPPFLGCNCRVTVRCMCFVKRTSPIVYSAAAEQLLHQTQIMRHA